ncbi:MAG: hypothetical protein JNM72_26125 [Deltaproteobacteria bacterium]|nr:hypothetical protein [Deltaproteobacteria bacterium]
MGAAERWWWAARAARVLVIAGAVVTCAALALQGAPVEAAPEAGEASPTRGGKLPRGQKAKLGAKAKGPMSPHAKAKAKRGARGLPGRAPLAGGDDAGPVSGAKLQALVRGQRVRTALPIVWENTQKNPDDADLHAAVAVLAERYGDWPMVLAEAKLATGNTVLVRDLILVHADGLRMAGEGAAAAALRSELVWEEGITSDFARVHALNARDLREAGDLWGADRELQRAVSYLPDGPMVLHESVEQALVIGDLEEAEFLLWRIERETGAPSSELEAATLRYGLLTGDSFALAGNQRMRLRKTVTNTEFAALRVLSEIRLGDVDPAVPIARRINYQMWGEVFHPEIRVALAALAVAENEPAELAEAIGGLERIFPRNPWLVAWKQVEPSLRPPTAAP